MNKNLFINKKKLGEINVFKCFLKEFKESAFLKRCGYAVP